MSAQPVLRNAEILARRAKEKIWEYRITVVPGINEEDIGSICEFLARLSGDLPACFLAFRPNYVLDHHEGASERLMRRCVELALDAGLKNAHWSGMANIPGKRSPVSPKAEAFYESAGARAAASYALASGCATHPRGCTDCPSRDSCTLKSHLPARSL